MGCEAGLSQVAWARLGTSCTFCIARRSWSRSGAAAANTSSIDVGLLAPILVAIVTLGPTEHLGTSSSPSLGFESNSSVFASTVSNASPVDFH